MECAQEIKKTKIVSATSICAFKYRIFLVEKLKKVKLKALKCRLNKRSRRRRFRSSLLNKEIKNRQKCAICYSGLFGDTPSTSEFSTPSHSFLSPINGHRGNNEITPFRASTRRVETESVWNRENSNDGREIAVVVELNGCRVMKCFWKFGVTYN